MAKVIAAVLAVALVVVAIALKSQVDGAREEGRAQARAAAEKAETCQQEAETLRGEVVKLKEQLARAMQQGPSAITLEEGLLALSAEKKVAPRSSGPIDPRPVIQQGRGGLQKCYEKALKRNANLQVLEYRMTLGFTVHGSGHTSDVTVKPSVDAELTRCIKDAVDRWRFQEFGGEAQTFEAPVTLSPKS